MTETTDASDRHHAPEGLHKGKTQLILIFSLIVALCIIAYLLLFSNNKADLNEVGSPLKQPSSQLHTAKSIFEMPVFSKSELAAPEPIAVVEKVIVEDELEPLPEPEPIPLSVVLPPPVAKAEAVSTPTKQSKNKPMSDDERRLGGGVSGSQGIPVQVAQQPFQASVKDKVAPVTDMNQGGLGDAVFIPSRYEYKEEQGKSTEAKSTGELTGSDMDRLDRLAALYGVSDRFSRASNTQVGFSAAGSDSANSLSSAPSDESRDVSYTPISSETPKQEIGQRGGVDLTSTQAIGVEAQRINLEYLLKRGTYIACVLKTRIVSDQAGFISCSITEDIYSADGTNLLLPRGSDILGEYKPKSLSNGKVRLQAVWDAVTTPDGIRVNLASPSTGHLGAAGIGGYINNHYGKKVGIPILLSLFRTAVDYRTRNYSGESGAYKSIGSDAADNMLSDQIQEYEEIRPTLTKHQGTTIGIMVARDVSFNRVLTGSR